MKNVQDIYPVSPMQEFMLLHGLSHTNSDTLFNQFVFAVDHALNPDVFHRAWSDVIASHASLRTAFLWKGMETPQQVVRQSVDLDCEVIDFRHFAREQIDTKINDLLSNDRQAGFDFRRAPLMRFKLIRLGQHSWRMVWSSHHMILDRWCIDSLFAQFQKCYRAHLTKRSIELAKAPSYRDYIAWMKQQDQGKAISYWSKYLRGFNAPTTVGRLQNTAALKSGENVAYSIHALGLEFTEGVRNYAGKLGITTNCVIQAALALALNRLLERSDIVFGVTVSGRPVDLAHVEDIVGSFINTVPVRVRCSSTRSIGTWLRDLNADRFSSSGFEYLSPAQIRSCASLTIGQPLFDVLMVWLSQTRLQQSSKDLSDELPLVPLSEQFATTYPLTVSVIEKTDELVLRADATAGSKLPLAPLLEQVVVSLKLLLDADSEKTLVQVTGVTLSSESDGEELDAQRIPESANRNAAAAVEVAHGTGRENVQLELMEELLHAEWQQVLGTSDEFTSCDDFFELGGDSLKAAALHANIEAATRKTVPLLTLFERATLGDMAKTLVHEQWPLRAGIPVPLKHSGSGPVLFCIASPEVNTIGYAILARHLPDDRNIVLLQAPPDSDDLQQLHPAELPALAVRYLKAMKEIQPDGPYCMLSMCSGAHIALDMIRQIEANGEKVNFAGVINTWSLYSVSWRFYLNRLSNIAAYYRRRIIQTVSEGLPFSKTASTSCATETARLGVESPKTGTKLSVLPADSAVGLDNPWINLVGFSNLLPDSPAVKTEITVFRLTRQPYWRIADETLGWGRLAIRALKVDVEGDDHDAILREPAVRQIAPLIEKALVNAME